MRIFTNIGNHNLRDIHDEVEGFVENMFNEFPDWEIRNPKVNVYEDEEAYYIETELPGLSEDDIKISLEDKNLIIESVVDKEDNDKKKYLIHERKLKNYKRNFSLPKNCNPKDISATMEKGILTVKIGKKEKDDAREIKIKSL